MSVFLGLIFGVVIGVLLNTLLIWIVGKLGWGMEVAGIGPAFLAALVVGVLNAIASMIMTAIGFPSISVLVHILLTAAFLYFVGPRIKGLKVNGFGGALIASVAIAAVAWLINWLVGLVL